MGNSKVRVAAAICLSVALFATACAVNPATGKRQLMLVSQDQEAAIGAQSDPAIVAQMGLYEDDALQAYVARIGGSIASRSERPDLDWTFRVLDDPLINAFALPGGYIYVTRGILAHFNSEAELASVLGHEIGHVTARHGANRISKAQLAQVGLGVGMILDPESAQQYGGLAQTGLGLLFLKYSRDDERQADELGLRYMVSADYDPRPMPDVFETLRRVGEDSESGRAPGWLSTHPVPENRRDWVNSAIASLNLDYSGRVVGANDFLSRIDGIMFGENPRHGYFEGPVFYHPDMRFTLRFPEGWKTNNARQSVSGVSAERDAALQLTLASKPTAAEALNEFMAQQGVQRKAAGDLAIAGFTGSGGEFSAATQQGTLEGAVAFIEDGTRVFALMGYGPQASWSARRGEVLRAIRSFARLSDPAKLDVSPRHLHVVRVDRRMSIAEFARRYGSSVPAEELQIINHLEPGDALEAGSSYKVVR